MLDIAFELIGEATSNSLLMFCFCNLIIVMILTGSSKPGSMNSQNSTFVTPVTVSYNMCYISSDDHDCGDDDDEEMSVADVSYAQDEPLINDSSSDEEEDGESSRCSDDDYDDDDASDDDDEDVDDYNDDDDENKEAQVEEEEGEDDLRMRVEEFIAKINNEWRHEKLKSLNLVY